MASDVRQLVVVLGDQLDRRSAALDDFDKQQDRVWMAEVNHEATHVWCHKLRLVAFFSAMRHFRDELLHRDYIVEYHQLESDARRDSGKTFSELLGQAIRKFQPQRVVCLEPGDDRVFKELQQACKENQVNCEFREDRHFYDTISGFNDWAKGRKRLVLEDYYRHLRKRFGVLLTDDGRPAGGNWNYDEDNRDSFSADGPNQPKSPRSFRTDELTDGVIKMVESRFGDHPGCTDAFDLPVTRKQALALLRDFIEHRLPNFGRWQDAMWRGEHFLYHSRLSFALNIHLLNPKECVDAAVEAWQQGYAPLNSVEGFVRQILGWREFIRGVYFREMPGYIELNALDCASHRNVPKFYWDGETHMGCVHDAMQNVLQHGYAHHIQRLMVLGLFAQLYGVHPRHFHDWHMAMYADAIDWVSLPNTLGMSQYGDGGIVGTKPYIASGNYINKMGNYCNGCRYNYRESTGDKACPFTTLYWDFLDRHSDQLQGNRRMTFQLKNLERKSHDELSKIRQQAQKLKEQLDNGQSV